jgi:hypothetical protein
VSAILALRSEIALHQALIDLLLDGQIDAEVIDREAKLTASSFRFRALPSDEECNERESPNKTGI